MAEQEPREELDTRLRRVNPVGDLQAQASLAKLQASLFGRTRDAVLLGRYVLEERIGAGGSGVVYRALDPKHGRKVAIKLLHAGEGPGYEAARARLLREAQSLAKLSHPNVVRVFDVGAYDPAVFDPSPGVRRPAPDDRRPAPPAARGVYVAMEFLDGLDLSKWLAVEPRGWLAVREVFLAAGRGLCAAHAVGLIHRDFKPANVSVDHEGRVRVLDFGLARPLDKHIPDPSMAMTAGAQQRLEQLARPFDATLTAPGTLLGTPAYMAPEQHALTRGSALSDQYSFCLALYEAWYGHRPFFADNEQELHRLKQDGQLLPVPGDCEVPSHLLEVLRRGLRPRPEERYPSMEALLEALQAPPPRAFALTPRGLAGLMTGALLLAGLGLVGWGWWRADSCETQPWAEVWGEPQRRALQVSAEAQPEPYAAKVAARLGEQLDGLVEAAHRLELERCEAGLALPPHVAACLDRQRDRLAGLVESLSSASGEGLIAAEQGLARWPTPAECLARTDAPAAVAIDDAMDEVARLEAQGRRAEALEAARALREQAATRGDAAIAVRAAATLGHAALRHGELELAETALAEALWSGSSLGQPVVMARAASDLLELAYRSAGQPRDAALWGRQARELAVDASLPDPLRARLLIGLGRLSLREGEPRRAQADLERALERATEAAATPLRLEAQHVLTRALYRQGEVEAASGLHRRLLTEARGWYGQGHPELRALAVAPSG